MNRYRLATSFSTLLVSVALLVTAACASTPKPAPEPAASAPASAAPAAPAAAAAPEPAKPASLNPAGDDPMAASWADYQPQPPDGQWLVDLEGREYFIMPYPKEEGYYARVGPNEVRVRHGITLMIEREDEHTFYAKIFKLGKETGPAPGGSSKPAKPSEEELAKIAKEYAVSTATTSTLAFSPIGAGLPTQAQWRNGFAIADVDGDGALDLVHGPPRRSASGMPAIFRGDGKGGFSRWQEAKFPPYPYDYGDVAAGDFNGDGKTDLAFAMHLRGLVAMLGDGKGSFTPFSEGLELVDPTKTNWSANPFTSRAVKVVDWNRDGRDDLLALSEGPSRSAGGKASSYVPGKRIYLAGPKGWTLAEGSDVADSTIGDTIALGDFNADKRTDFLTGTSITGSKAILNFAATGTSWKVATIESVRQNGAVRGVAAADVNGDRRGDLFVSWVNLHAGIPRVGVDLMMSHPNGWTRTALWGREGRSEIRSLAVGDLDGDGRHDVVGFADDGQLVVLKGQGKGKFTLEQAEGIAMKSASCPSYRIALADLDRDGRDEIVASFAGEQCEGKGSIRAWKAQAKTK